MILVDPQELVPVFEEVKFLTEPLDPDFPFEAEVISNLIKFLMVDD